MTRIGPAGWAYKDWKGIVYPARKERGFHELTFLATYFDVIEINTSFYRPFTAKTAAGWIERIENNARFRFTAKLWRGFTHERTAGSADEHLFKEGLTPLVKAGRLGALLLQFPWSFRNTDENRAYVTSLCARFREYPLVLEVRHASWSEPGVLSLLEDLNLGLCNIDQPLFKRSIRPGAIATARVGYIRLHGRNYQTWFTENKHVGERYDYLYSPEELDPWIDRIKAVEQAAQETYVVTNNHYLGKGVVNAFEIASVLKGQTISPPPQLIEHYPVLDAFAGHNDAGGRQLSLPIE
jgi:uncharacterized protein YecE (DUF72 family)